MSEFRIYLNKDCTVWAVVDEEDYHYFSKWKWHAHRPSPNGWKRHGKKVYARRSQGRGGEYKPPLYLHVEILKRSGKVAPTLFHTISDHQDGDTLNCQRSNLEWATPRENALNRKRSKPNDNPHPSIIPTPSADASTIPF